MLINNGDRVTLVSPSAYGFKDSDNIIVVRKLLLNSLTEICSSVVYEVNYSKHVPAYLFVECKCESCLYHFPVNIILRDEMIRKNNINVSNK
jgi:hypothetical protein